MCPYLSIGGQDIPMYGLMIAIGFVIGALVCLLNCKRFDLKKRHIFGAGLFIIIGMVLGSKLLFAISVLPEIISNSELAFSNPAQTLVYALSGYVYYGGLFGLLIALFIYSVQFHQSFSMLSAVIIPAIPLAHAFGRIGCFFAGCCYGMESTGFLSVTYPVDALNYNIAGTSRLAIQLIEALFNLLIFIILMYFSYKKPVSNTNKKITAGFISHGHYNTLTIYLILYPLLRFILEFFRGDEYRGLFGPFSTSQWVSLIILLAVILPKLKKITKSAH